MAKTIFRKINGRIVPFKIKEVIKKASHEVSVDMILQDKSGSQIGKVWSKSHNPKKMNRFEVGSRIDKEFRGFGIGQELYNRMTDRLREMGAKSIFGYTSNIGKIGKIRANIGKTRIVTSKDTLGVVMVTSLKKKIRPK